jgi:hypothetical protein
MSEVSDHKLIEWGKRGIIPGPNEEAKDFSVRASSLLPLHDDFSSELTRVYDLYSVKPDWIKIDYSNRGLLPWQGGCVMVEDDTISMQMRKAYQKRKKIWGIYKKEEIVAHELVHVARATFEEPVFEEILAYQTSTSKFRRFLGPLFRSSKESIIFMVVLFGLTIVNLLYTLPLTLLSGGGGVVLLFFFRLYRNHKTFGNVMKKLKELLGCEKRALSCALRLTDREIFSFAKKSKEEIAAFAEKAKQESLRWRQIYLLSFVNKH